VWQQEDRKQRLLALMSAHHPRLGACSAMRDLDPAVLQNIARALYPPHGPDRVWQQEDRKPHLLALMQGQHPRLGARSALRDLDVAVLQSIARAVYPPRSTALVEPRFTTSHVEPRRWPCVPPYPTIFVVPDDDVAAAAAPDTMDAGTGGGRAAADAAAGSADAGGGGTRDCLPLLCPNDRESKGLMLVNKGLLLVRHGGENRDLSFFNLCNDVVCYGCGEAFQPDFAALLPWMECDSLRARGDHGWVHLQYSGTQAYCRA
jgi:hypothetical protein